MTSEAAIRPHMWRRTDGSDSTTWQGQDYQIGFIADSVADWLIGEVIDSKAIGKIDPDSLVSAIEDMAVWWEDLETRHQNRFGELDKFEMFGAVQLARRQEPGNKRMTNTSVWTNQRKKQQLEEIFYLLLVTRLVQ